jgi:ATP-dependent DNA ligase
VPQLGQHPQEALSYLNRFAFSGRNPYFSAMPKFEFCLPTLGKAVPAGPEWFHEIKYDGYRLRVERDGERVRLITKRGYDWTPRYPWIVEAALKNRTRQFVIDGEAVVLRVDGISDFNALHSGRRRLAVAKKVRPQDGRPARYKSQT